MLYYKIPLAGGGLSYPAGCILICAYTYDGYEYCKFERVTAVGSDWVAITESEFNVRCPEFPEPATPPVQEVIATSSMLNDNGSIVLELPRPVNTGSIVKFYTICPCFEVTGGLVIDRVTYSVVDSMGKVVTGIGGVWEKGVYVAVIIDKDMKRAYFQGTTALKNILASSPLILVEGRDYGTTVPGNLAKGQLFFKKVYKLG